MYHACQDVIVTLLRVFYQHRQCEGMQPFRQSVAPYADEEVQKGEKEGWGGKFVAKYITWFAAAMVYKVR